MSTLRHHLRFRRHESLGRKLLKTVERVVVDVLAALSITRRLWRHRPSLLQR